MKKLLFFLPFISVLFSCGETTKQEVKSFWDQCDVIAKREVINGDTVIVCDSKLVKQKKNIPLDLLGDSIEVIKMDNKNEEALISKRFVHTYFTENYIGVTAYSYFPMKLFRKDGTFLRHIGAIGQGTGEYTVIDAIDMDEKNDRIYILPFSADYILVYDFKG
ncbi:MAG: 6-bladed beta-propeller, partial [Bacteroidota bacterium]|nr:6-bladed beta-propeller [Bacteroidota bacterium]